MTTTPFSDNVSIDGSRDVTQLTVDGHSTQNQPLQEWKNSAGSTLAQVTGDGRVLVGDDLGVATPDSLVEVHRADTSTAKPKRGFHSLGRIGDALSEVVNWSVHELELLGNGVVSALQTALRVRATYDNAATSSSADLRAVDAEAGIKQGQVNTLTALRAAISKVAGTVAAAYGVKIESVTAGSSNYALHTGTGMTHLGDTLELVAPSPVPGTPATNEMRVYPKSDGKLYAKNSSGVEFDLTGGAPAARVCDGRLTLTSNTPITVSDVTGTLLYFKRFRGSYIGLFDGSAWAVYPFDEISIKLTDTQNGTTTNASAIVTGLTDTSQLIVGMQVSGTGIPANTTIASINSATQVTLNNNATASGTVALTFKVAPNTNLDIFVFANAGTPKLEMVAWTNNTTRAVALTTQDGILVKNAATTRRYLGTVRTNATAGQSEDSMLRRFVWNYHQRFERLFEVIDSANSWSYTTAAWRSLNNSTLNRVEFVMGVKEDPIYLDHHGFSSSTAGGSACFGVCLDNTNANDALIKGASPGSTSGAMAVSTYRKLVAEGYHFLQLTEYGGAGVTFFGDGNLPTAFQLGGVGHIMA